MYGSMQARQGIRNKYLLYIFNFCTGHHVPRTGIPQLRKHVSTLVRNQPRICACADERVGRAGPHKYLAVGAVSAATVHQKGAVRVHLFTASTEAEHDCACHSTTSAGDVNLWRKDCIFRLYISQHLKKQSPQTAPSSLTRNSSGDPKRHERRRSLGLPPSLHGQGRDGPGARVRHEEMDVGPR